MKVGRKKGKEEWYKERKETNPTVRTADDSYELKVEKISVLETGSIPNSTVGHYADLPLVLYSI
jgi:hypothetical protein